MIYVPMLVDLSMFAGLKTTSGTEALAGKQSAFLLASGVGAPSSLPRRWTFACLLEPLGRVRAFDYPVPALDVEGLQ